MKEKENSYNLLDIIKNTEGNLYWKNKKLEYLGCNNNFLKVSGMKTLKSILGKSDKDLFSNVLSEKRLRIIQENDLDVIKKEKNVLIEETGINAQGKIAQYITKKSPLYDTNGTLVGLVGTSIDITAQKELEKSKAKQKELEKLSHYTRLAAGLIAHDLRTPLASIQSAMVGIDHNLPRLINGYQRAKEAGLQVERIRKEGLEALKKITESCLSEIKFSNHYINLILANLDSDEINTENYKNYAIARLIQESVQSYPCRELERALIHLDLNQNFEFWGNDAYVKNMVNNLLKNALYYIADSRKGEIFIKTYSSKDSKFNYLSFKDTAKGAPPEVVGRMFDGFYSKRQGGTGLGLSFCKNTMNSFGGNIEAHSIEGEYMEFLLSFPKLL